MAQNYLLGAGQCVWTVRYIIKKKKKKKQEEVVEELDCINKDI